MKPTPGVCRAYRHLFVSSGRVLARSSPYLESKSSLSSSTITSRFTTSTTTRNTRGQDNGHSGPNDFEQILFRPSWSARALLPADTTSGQQSEASGEGSQIITAPQLRHLLRLSALPLPKSPEEESAMIEMLQSQLHFVRDIQSVDTSGIKPLSAIRDETAAGREEQTICLDQMLDELSHEVSSGRCKRPRKIRSPTNSAATRTWDPLRTAPRRSGQYFVVDTLGDRGKDASGAV